MHFFSTSASHSGNGLYDRGTVDRTCAGSVPGPSADVPSEFVVVA